ncbi:hypothetical protein [Methylorubrum aminovorans]
MTHHAKTAGASAFVTFPVTGALLAALDNEAAARGETRSHRARQILATALRDAGRLALDAPVSLLDERRQEGAAR